MAFSLTIILMPFKARLAQWPRQVGSIWNDYTDFILFASDAAVLLTVVLWAAAVGISKKKISRGPMVITWPLAALSVIAFVSAIMSLDMALSLYHVARLILLFALYLYLVNEIKSIGQLIVPFSIMVAVQSIIAIGQFQLQSNMGLQALGEYALNPSWSGISIVNVNGERWLRAYGLSDHPNILGGILAFGLLLQVVWFINKTDWQRYILLALFGAGTLGLVVTYSRSAWLALAGGVIVIIFLSYRSNRKKDLWQFGWLALAIIVAAIPLRSSILAPIGSRLGNNKAFAEVPSENASLEERAYLNDINTEIFFENGLFGVGPGATPQAIQVKYPEFPTYYQPGHIALLNVASDTGIFGATFFGALLIGPWVALAVDKRLTHGPFLMAASAMLMGTFLVGLFDYYTWFLTPGRLAQWIIWGLWGSAYLTEITAAPIQEVEA